MSATRPRRPDSVLGRAWPSAMRVRTRSSASSRIRSAAVSAASTIAATCSCTGFGTSATRLMVERAVVRRKKPPTDTSGLTCPSAVKPRRDRAEMAAPMGGRADLGGVQRRRRAPRRPRREYLRAGDAALPTASPISAPEDYSLGDAMRTSIAHGPPRAASDGLRRLRRRPRTTRSRPVCIPASPRRLDSSLQRAFSLVGHFDRLVAELASHEPATTLDQWIFLKLYSATRLPQGGGRQVVPQRPDRSQQQVIDGAASAAVRGRGAAARAVVPSASPITPTGFSTISTASTGPSTQVDAAQLDWSQRGRRGWSSRCEDVTPPTRSTIRSSHPARHPVRRDLLRDGARAPRRLPPAAGTEHEGRSTGTSPRADRQGGGSRRRDKPKTGVSSPERAQSGQRRGAPHVRRRLRLMEYGTARSWPCPLMTSGTTPSPRLRLPIRRVIATPETWRTRAPTRRLPYIGDGR